MGDTSTKYKGWSHSPDETREPDAAYPTFSGDNRDQHGYLYWCALWMGACQRILVPGGIVFVFTDWRQLPTTTDSIQAGGFVWRGVVVWDKQTGRPVKGRFRNHIEFICWATNGAMSEANAVYPSSVITRSPPTSATRQHRTEKPVELLEDILTITKPCGVVLDPFMGSGSTGAACAHLGHPFVGIEMEPRYFDIACERIAREHAQGKLNLGVSA